MNQAVAPITTGACLERFADSSFSLAAKLRESTASLSM
jgi:hypothetical protein